RWTKEAHGGGDEHRLSWTESRVEVDGKKLDREGFGMEMLRRSLPYDLQAKTQVELRPDGLHFEMSMPLSKRHASAGRQ
ncbi:hypothetical protein, partial [Salmonella sp. SAL4438]|uniref:hypothetical protein n=1 Tax=Salmonella sp. SAL4438 TaxID=3159893 RepID=UPI00397AC6D1